MIKLIRDGKGFTLIELMVVVAIMSVLAALVAGGVTGTQTKGVETQVRNDASTFFSSAQNYNNSSRTRQWPEDTLPAASSGITYQGISISSSYISAINITDSGGVSSNFTTPGWLTTTYVRRNDGSIALATFVPDFMPEKPDSTRLTAIAANGVTYPEFLWLLKKGTALDDSGRSVQIWKLSDDRNSYTKIYPKVD